MAQLDFLIKEVKDIANPSLIEELVSLDEFVFAYLNYCINNESYEAVENELKKLDIDEKGCEFIIYRLRKSLNESDKVFFNDIASDIPKRAKSYEDASMVDKHIHFGACWIREEEYNEALKCLDKALALDDRAILAYANKASIAVFKGRKQEALQLFNKALEIDPNHVQILANKMVLLTNFSKSTLVDFKNTINAILLNKPNHAMALNYGIQLAFISGDIPLALKYVKLYFVENYLEEPASMLLINVMCRLGKEEALRELTLLESSMKGIAGKEVVSDNKTYYLQLKFTTNYN